MDQIVVPQFLDVEDKIIGPVTVRQFIEMLIGGLIIFIFYKVFDFSLFLVGAIIVGVAVIVMAFVKINGQNFHYFLLNLIDTLRRPKLQVWHQRPTKQSKQSVTKEEGSIQPIRTKTPVSSSRLSELSLIVDTGGVYRGEGDDIKIN